MIKLESKRKNLLAAQKKHSSYWRPSEKYFSSSCTTLYSTLFTWNLEPDTYTWKSIFQKTKSGLPQKWPTPADL